MSLLTLLIPIVTSIFKKLIRTDILLIGLLKDYSKLEIKKFDEFLQILQKFAFLLKNNLSPEKAFVMAYSQNKKYLKLLDRLIQTQVSNLLNLSYPFNVSINAPYIISTLMKREAKFSAL